MLQRRRASASRVGHYGAIQMLYYYYYYYILILHGLMHLPCFRLSLKHLKEDPPVTIVVICLVVHRSWRMQCAKTVRFIVNCRTTPLYNIFSTEVVGKSTKYIQLAGLVLKNTCNGKFHIKSFIHLFIQRSINLHCVAVEVRTKFKFV